MMTTVPGTLIPFVNGMEKHAFAVLSPVLSVTKGLTLGQIRELTGLETSTIQNWVKRGWIANPQGKRYGERQIVRIILINMLRNALKLDTIVELMAYINGSVESEADDIIPDKELFNYLCSIIYLVDEMHSVNKEEIHSIIDEELMDYKGPQVDSKERLSQSLLVMTLAYISSEIQKQAEEEYKKINF